MAPDMASQLTGKDLDAGKDWRQKEKGVAEDEMVRWHHQLNGHECKQTLGQEFKWRTGKLGMLQSMGSQRVRLNWATKQEKQPTYTYILLSWYPYPHRWLVRGGEQRKKQPEKEGEMRHREKRGVKARMSVLASSLSVVLEILIRQPHKKKKSKASRLGRKM